MCHRGMCTETCVRRGAETREMNCVLIAGSQINCSMAICMRYRAGDEIFRRSESDLSTRSRKNSPVEMERIDYRFMNDNF